MFFKPNVEKLKARKDVDGLIAALNHKQWDVFKDAMEALVSIGDARAVEPLIKALEEGWVKAYGGGRINVSTYAANALGEIGDVRAVEPLIKLLSDKEVSSTAASVLGQIGDAKAVGPLIEALKDKNNKPYVREQAASALGQIGDARAIRPLIDALRDKDTGVRLKAASVLGKIGDNIILPILEQPLKKALEDKDIVVRNAAADSLRQLGCEVESKKMGSVSEHGDKVVEHFLNLYSKEISKHIYNPQMPEPMKKVLNLLLHSDWIDTLDSSLKELVMLADRDNQSHSKQYHPPGGEQPFVSVAIWPDTTAENLAERFQQEIGIPYYEAQMQYGNKYRAYGGPGFAHLFFYYSSSQIGVAIAFLPYTADESNWAWILPDSMSRQLDRYRNKI